MENMVIYIQHGNKFHKFHIQHGNLFQQNEDMKKNILAFFERLACSDKLVGGIPAPLKNMKVNWDYYSQYMKK